MQLDKFERCQVIMRYLHNEPKTKKHTQQTIAMNTGIPFSSVRKCINVDFPSVFMPDRFTGGYTLSGEWPGGYEFDLEPPVVKGAAKFQSKFIDQAAVDLTEFLSPKGQELLRSVGKNSDDYWRIYNTAQLMTVLLKIKVSRDPHKRAGELIEKPNESQALQAILKSLDKKPNATS